MKNSIPLLALALLWLITGCSHKIMESEGYYSPSFSEENEAYLASGENISFDTQTRYEKRLIDRKILFSARLTLTVKNIDTANAILTRIAKDHGGYVQESGTYRSVIRVKSDHLQDALNEIALLGKVQDKDIRGQDVTDEYLDYQIRLENAMKARERYLDLLAKAENVEAALKVEKELERLNETIDMLKGRIQRINHLAEFSTITINLKEKKKPGVLGYVGMGLYYSVKWLFVRN